jgi:murein L,D-transpeptidase YcbB/YkuD
VATAASRIALLCGLLSWAIGAAQAGAAAPYRWFVGGHPTAQAVAVLAQLNAAGDHGLRPDNYVGAGATSLSQRVEQLGSRPTPDPALLTELDAALNVAALRYANDLHRGRVDPRNTGIALRRPRPPMDEALWLPRLAASADVAAEFRALEPVFVHYQLLKDWLVKYRALAQQQPALTMLPPLPARSVSVKAGGLYAGADALRRLLVALGDLPGGQSAPRADGVFDAGLSAAVAHFQERHGLAADGALGRRTFDALTTPLSRRVRQIELTLERWRWVPDFSAPPIIINIPQFRLFAFRSTQDRVADILQMDVIVGQSYDKKRTPVFVAEMQQVVFRPYWDVPPSILHNELMASIRRDSAYLERNEMEIVRGQGDDGKVVAATPENLDALAAGQLRLRQRSGPKNALGPVKFIFPNDFGVYLHGTPAQQLFAQSRRDFSHGCIRLSDPAALAVHVLRNVGGGWPLEKVQAAMQGEPNQRIKLPQSVPVMVLYGTALATEDGRILFFDDIYGHDRRLEKLLPAVD